MSIFFKSFCLAAFSIITNVSPVNAVELNGFNYCVVTITKNDNSEQYTILVPKVNLDEIAKKHNVVTVNCDETKAPQSLF